MTGTVAAVINLVLGALLVVLGWWGVRNAATAAPAALPEHDRKRRARVVRRGAITCQVLAVVFLVVGVANAFQ